MEAGKRGNREQQTRPIQLAGYRAVTGEMAPDERGPL
jgi:hypothetical protein